MAKIPGSLTTERPLLRQWHPSDLDPYAELNADPRVREFFPSVLTREECKAQIDILFKGIEERGWGLWAVEVLGGPKCIGFIGIQPVPFQAPFTPAVEIGWRLAFEHWGKGYATEGARAALQFGFEQLELPFIVAFTPVNNLRSRKVMKRLGMHQDPLQDFDHPEVPDGTPLKRHVLYRIDNLKR